MLEIFEEIGELIFGNKRLAALKHFAVAKNFQFRRKVNPLQLPVIVRQMSFFVGGRSKSLKGYLNKNEPRLNTAASIFDYVHKHEFGIKSTTVFLYKSKYLDLPKFIVSPRHPLSKIGNIFSSTEWSQVNKSFDKEFTVSATEMNEMRMMITIQFAENMLKLKGYELEGNGEYLVIYRKHTAVDIIDMDNINDIGLELVDIITNDSSQELM